MSLSKHDREFRLPKISYIDFTHLEMDRVLTSFLARLHHNGYPSRLSRKSDLSVEAFVDEFLEHPEWFQGFEGHRDVTERWVETHLMDLVNRGKANQVLAAPRPLHGYSYRFRNTRHSRPYSADQHLYELIYGARSGMGQRALDQLKSFFFTGVDAATKRIDHQAIFDVETQAVLRLPHDQVSDAADTSAKARESHPPLCVGAADLLAEDIMRLLFYERFIPRSVMVDYLKVLLSFHLALYHLRLFKLLPALVRQQAGDPICAACPMNPRDPANPQGDCPHRIGLLLDVAGQPDTPMAQLAQRSADVHYRRIPGFIKAYFVTKKLDEMAAEMVRRGKLSKPAAGHFSVGEVLELLQARHKSERDIFFGQRLYQILQDSSASADTELDPEIQAAIDMNLPDFDTYIEILVAMRGDFHRRGIVKCIDSLLMKNDPGALLAQANTKNAPRRFVLDSRLLEVLLQVAVLQPGGTHGYHTGEMRIDQLLTFLRQRYGLHIDQLPSGDGFGPPSIDDRKALRANEQAFIGRLREVGFFRDLSDAYVTQTVTPRYQIDKHEPAQSQSSAQGAPA